MEWTIRLDEQIWASADFSSASQRMFHTDRTRPFWPSHQACSRSRDEICLTPSRRRRPYVDALTVETTVPHLITQVLRKQCTRTLQHRLSIPRKRRRIAWNTKLTFNRLGLPQADAMAHAISSCVHCGFCLPACPTYQVLGEEMDSPRGDIVLMRGVLEKTLPLDAATPYLDRCLGCLGCVTACPSGVPYGELLSSFRAYSEDKRHRPIVDRVARKMASQTLPFPTRFRWAAH